MNNHPEATLARATPSSLTTFLVVRHGETEWNQIGRIQGQKNSPLNAEGKAQAQALARVLGQWLEFTGVADATDQTGGGRRAITQLISSDLGRTLETAAPIATALGLVPQLDPRLRERAFGVFEGLQRGQMEASNPAAFAAWQARTPEVRVPGGESLDDLNARLTACLNDLAQRYAGQVLCVVSHGGALDSLYRLAAGVPMQAPRTWSLSNASLNTITIDGQGRWKVAAWGDVRHLARSEDEQFV
jgi:probable phosphoglycerate mutase